jgi:hypothetical protein
MLPETALSANITPPGPLAVSVLDRRFEPLVCPTPEGYPLHWRPSSTPDSLPLRLLLGDTLLRSGAPLARAERLFLEVLKRQPDHPLAWRSLELAQCGGRSHECRKLKRKGWSLMQLQAKRAGRPCRVQ